MTRPRVRTLLRTLPQALLAAAALGSAPPAARPRSTPGPAPTPTPVPGEIRVSVTVVAAGQKKSPAVDAVVWIPEPGAPLPAQEHGRIVSRDKRFQPRISVVPAGGSVDFPNMDRIHHNVFSLSERAKFDLGLYKNGASRSMAFENPGLVRIYCNIHPQMAAFLYVVDGRRYAQTGPDGVAVLPGVPPGRYTVKVWDEKGGEWSGAADVRPASTTPLPVTLDAAAWRETPHKRKDGTNYPPPDDDENRY